MPYLGASDPTLPEHVASEPDETREQWVSVFNATFEETGDEGQAFAVANGTLGEKTIKYVGEAVKRVSDKTYGGYCIVFSDPNSPDLEDDFFTQETYLFDNVPTSVILHDHTMGAHPKGIQGVDDDGNVDYQEVEPRHYEIGKVTKRMRDERGVWLEFKLNEKVLSYDEKLKLWSEIEDQEHQEWLEYIQRRLDDGDYYNFSTDSMEHLVEKVPVVSNGKRVHWIKSWVLPIASITPRAAEPRAKIKPVTKSVIDDDQPEEHQDRIAQEGQGENVSKATKTVEIKETWLQSNWLKAISNK